MIGVFDSGAGGVAAVNELRALAPLADICFFADRKNAPYGTKSKHELIKLVKQDIRILKENQASKILMACCTASTVYSELSAKERSVCVPIIAPTAKAAIDAAKRKRIAVIATRYTVSSHAFRNEILRLSEDSYVFEKEAQYMVDVAERMKIGIMPTLCERAKIRETLKIIKNEDVDLLILGCTHFSLLGTVISEECEDLVLIDSAKEGAKSILCAAQNGNGSTIYL